MLFKGEAGLIRALVAGCFAEDPAPKSPMDQFRLLCIKTRRTSADRVTKSTTSRAMAVIDSMFSLGGSRVAYTMCFVQMFDRLDASFVDRFPSNDTRSGATDDSTEHGEYPHDCVRRSR